MDNSIFITRFLEQNKNTAISYVDVINCVFDKLSIFEDTMMKIDDYYNEYIHIHRLQHDNIFKFFDGKQHFISLGESNNKFYCSELKKTITELDICYYMIDNYLFDNILFATRLDFVQWTNSLNVIEPLKSSDYSVFREIRDGMVEIDSVMKPELRLICQGIKENNILLHEINNQIKYNYNKQFYWSIFLSLLFPGLLVILTLNNKYSVLYC